MFGRKNASAEIADGMENYIINSINTTKELSKSIEKDTNKFAKIVAKIKCEDPATKNLTSKKMIENLKEKGWVFNADDFNNIDENYSDHNCLDLNHIENDSKKKKLFLLEKSNKYMRVALELMKDGNMQEADKYLDKADKLFQDAMKLA